MKRLALIIALALAAPVAVVAPEPAVAVQPDEVLDDAAMEARARAISQKLRCPVCQGENIDDSNAAISRDLRLYVRERLVAGDSDDQVIDNVVARYGEFVLFEPRARGMNWALWLAGPVMGLIALAFAWGYLSRRREIAGPAPLTDDEKARLDRLMRD